MAQIDIWGNPVEERNFLRDKFIEPPFSFLDAKTNRWMLRKNKWKSLGIKSELGRDATIFNMSAWAENKRKNGELSGCILNDTSIFDPVLCEILYNWFCPDNGAILDPFCGGSVRGIVANYLGYYYTGIDIRQEQIDSNREQALDILSIDNQPNYYVGDSNKVLDNFANRFDFVFSCPPYSNLEVYSDLEGDISNMNYNDFMIAYSSIIKKCCDLLKNGAFACFVVGEVRDKKGNYIGFVPDTINAFKSCGMQFYNEIIFLTSLGSAAIRANNNMMSQKVVKVHQNILVFKKTS